NVLAVQAHNNSLASTDFSMIPQLKITRDIPAGQDDADIVKITARVEDADGVKDVNLQYQRLSCPYGTGLVLGDWKTVRMVDNGTQGDAVAGDSIYTFQLNYAETLRPREIWRYRIAAVDQAGQESIMPLPNETTRNYAFFVEDRNNRPAFPTVYIFAEREVINWLNRNVESNQEQPALVVAGGDVYDLYFEGGIRYHGDTDRTKPKKNWRVRFPKGARWDDQRVMNLYANYQDSPLVRGESGFLEHLAFQFFREAGVPVPDTRHYRLMVNNSYYGLFLQVEEYNEDFVARHGQPAETRIYQAGVKARRSYMVREPNFEAYASKYRYTMGRDDDIAPLIAFIEE
ncbi:MAG TPA: CotH kinase family protein, partial [bacterium]|nr:CotH kinase family protein [bacterium]